MGKPATYTLVGFSEFYDHMMPELPGITTSLVDQALRTAAITFCRRTRIWQETLTEDVTASQRSVVMPVPAQSAIYEVRRANLNGEKMDPFSWEEKDESNPKWEEDVGTPTEYSVIDEDEVALYPLPDATITDGLVVNAVLAPARDATQLPSFLRDRHFDVIAKGAKSALMLMAKKPWTDRDLSLKYASDFSIAIGQEAVRNDMGRTRMPIRTATVHGVK